MIKKKTDKRKSYFSLRETLISEEEKEISILAAGSFPGLQKERGKKSFE